MKSRNREINIFSLSLMDVISGAMGAFLIVTVILARFHAVDQEKYKDPEKLRKRLDAAMHALAVARVGTEETIKDRFTLGTKPKTLGLSGGETVPEIMALGRALRADIDTINDGFANALDQRGAAVDALAHASQGTEKLFKERITGAKPQTLGLSRGHSVREITALGGALQNDIATIHKDFVHLLDQRAAAAHALAHASAGTEKIFKDRIGARPQTLGLKRGETVSDIKKLDQALQHDIETIYKEMQRHNKNVPGTPFVVTSSFPCNPMLQIASDEIDPKTGKPYPPYIPNWTDSGIMYLNGPLSGFNSIDAIWFPTNTFMKSWAVPGRHYRIYLVNFSESCKGNVIMLGGRRVAMKDTSGHAFSNLVLNKSDSDLILNKTEHVSLSFPQDSVKKGSRRYGVYYFGTIAVDKKLNVTFARSSQAERDVELKAIQQRVDQLPANSKAKH